MGSCLKIRTFPDMPEAKLRAAVDEQCRDDGYSDGHSYSGSWGVKHGLVIDNHVCASVKEAEKLIEERSDKSDPLLAVRAVELVAKKTKRVQILEERVRAADKAVFEYSRSIVARVRSAKSKTRGCAKCGSAIAVQYIREDRCPVCGNAFLTTDTDRKRLEKLKQKLEALKQAVETQVKAEAEVLKRRGALVHIWVVGGWCRE